MNNYRSIFALFLLGLNPSTEARSADATNRCSRRPASYHPPSVQDRIQRQIEVENAQIIVEPASVSWTPKVEPSPQAT